jgi:signal transduction histidine kinase
MGRKVNMTVWRAALVAGSYFVVAAVYILVSSRIARWFSTDVDRLVQVEEIKGMVFVVVTAGAVFAATLAALRRTEHVATEIRRQREAIVTSEQQALAGMMAAGVAHDANNVLTSLLLELELMESETAPDPEGVSNAISSVKRLTDLNRRLLNAARQSTTGDARELDVGSTVKATLEVLRFHRAIRGCTIELEAAPGLTLRANPVLVHQVVSNFIVNAGEATAGKGHIVLRVERDGGSSGVRVHVDDDGPGVPIERRAELFAALKTTKATGTGLGLYSARACAAAVGGSVEVGDSPLGGARFTVVLPPEPVHRPSAVTTKD